MDAQSQYEKERKSINRKTLLLIAVLAAALWLTVPGWLELNKADGLMQEHRLADAVKSYERFSGHLIYGKRASEGLEKALTELAEEERGLRHYPEAATAYERLKDPEKVRQVWQEAAEYALSQDDIQSADQYCRELGDQKMTLEIWNNAGERYLSSSRYEMAAAAFGKAGNAEKIGDVHRAWGEYALSEGDFRTASEQFSLAGDAERARDCALRAAEKLLDEGKPQDVPAILETYAGADIAQLTFRAAQTEAGDALAPETARKYGERLRDTDTQLAYSKMLKDSGLNLKEVYPKGVAVDADLTRYQLWDFDSEQKVSFRKSLIFSRVSDAPDLTPISASAYSEIEPAAEERQERIRNDGSRYAVRLRPELMSDLLDDQQAWSTDECTAVILLDRGYLLQGELILRTQRQRSAGDLNPWNSSSSSVSDLLRGYYSGDYSPGTTSSYKVYSYYAAYAAIGVYDKENPKAVEYYDVSLYPPIAAGAVITDSSQDFSDLQEADVEEIQRALADKESEESQKILEKYDPKVVSLIEKKEWGKYILFRYKDADGTNVDFKGSFDDTSLWNTEKYMLGSFSGDWLGEQLAEGAMERISIYMFMSGD